MFSRLATNVLFGVVFVAHNIVLLKDGRAFRVRCGWSRMAICHGSLPSDALYGRVGTLASPAVLKTAMGLKTTPLPVRLGLLPPRLISCRCSVLADMNCIEPDETRCAEYKQVARTLDVREFRCYCVTCNHGALHWTCAKVHAANNPKHEIIDFAGNKIRILT